ncbi:MAG: DUF4344 domain-containing metallopeptidase [Pseudomonadota bacterium]
MVGRFLCLCAWLAAGPASADISRYTENNVLHVVAHEIGHAFVREFDIPILGNEEVMADAFATALLWREMPDRLPQIIADRTAQMRSEGDKESPFSEYPDDVWRAAQTICLFYALDPQSHFDLAQELGIGEFDGDCADRGTEIARSWRRVLAAEAMPQDARVTEVRAQIDDDLRVEFTPSPEFGEAVFSLLSGIDWHSQITLAFERCDGTASWARNGRRITICDAYVQRFEEAGP